MKKSILFVLLVAMFCLANVADAKANTGVFEVSQKHSLPHQYEHKGFSMKYPSNWVKAEQSSNDMFILLKNDSTDAFKSSMNVLTDSSNPYIYLMTVEDFKQSYAEKMKTEGFSSFAYVKVEKGKWQGQEALYIEYKGVYQGYELHCAQYIVDDTKNMFVLTFLSSENEWEETKTDMLKIVSSVAIKK